MPDLCPMGTDLDVKPSASSCPLTLPLYLGLPTEQDEGKDILQEGLLNRERSSNNRSSSAALDYIGFNGNSDSQIREGSKLKLRVKCKIEKKMRQRMRYRMRMRKKKQVSLIYSWEVCKGK